MHTRIGYYLHCFSKNLRHGSKFLVKRSIEEGLTIDWESLENRDYKDSYSFLLKEAKKFLES